MIRRVLKTDSIGEVSMVEATDDRFRAIVEASPSAILIVDCAGIITLVNRRCEQLFGYQRAELIGQHVECLVPARFRKIHPELRQDFMGRPTARPMGAGRDLFCRRKDGGELPVEIGLSPIKTGEETFVLTSIIDITERKKLEEESLLQTRALECAANGIVITDVNGKIVWVNRAFTESTGYASAEAIGRNPRMLKSGKQDRAFYERMWQTILSGKVWRDTIINRRKDGTLASEDLTITPIQNAAGSITHFIAIKQDITELEQALSAVRTKNEELAAMTQQLWQASRLATVGELAASVAHELNNPLATVSLRLETLGLQLAGDEQKSHAVQIVADEVERMGKLVSNLLQFSRRTHQQISTIDVREELNNSLELVEYHLRSNNIRVDREYAAELPTIQADRQQLRQVFLNLFTNATDAMKDGGVITVRATWHDHGNPQLIRIEVADTGGGIPSEMIDRIFDPFFTTKPEGKGTGLGLAICKRVIEEHRGTIAVDSRAGEGTCVTLQLPITSGNTHQIDAEYLITRGSDPRNV